MVHAGKALIVGLVYNAVRASAHGLRERAQAAHARRQGEGAKMRFGPGSRINRNSESGGSEILRSIITDRDRAAAMGTRWSQSTLGSHDFSLEWKLDSGGGNLKYDGTVALLITPTPDEGEPRGRFFGIDEHFTGLAVVIDAEQGPGLEDKYPVEHDERRRRVAIVANDGTRSYDDLMANLYGCTERMVFGETTSWEAFKKLPASRIRLKAYDNVVALDIDPEDQGVWRRCTTISRPALPIGSEFNSHVGVIPRTKGLDKFTFLSTVVNIIPNAAWETDSLGKDDHRMDVFEPPMDHELLGVGSSSSTANDAAEEAMQRQDSESIRRTRRILGRGSLKQACADDADFSVCSHHSSSVRQLENCFRKKGSVLSERCTKGIETWKNLLAQTAPIARTPPRGGSLTDHHKFGSLKHTRDRGISKQVSKNKRPHRADGIPLVSSSSRLVPESGPLPKEALRGRQDGGLRGVPPHDHKHGPHALDDGGRFGRRHGRGRGSEPGAELDDSPDLVSYIAIFGCVAGVVGLVFFGLYYFVLAFVTGVDRLVRWLGRDSRGHRGGGDGVVAPGGYQTLPGDSASAAATASGSGQRWFGSGRVGGGNARVDDDDSIVVTGTPVNPPPSVHL